MADLRDSPWYVALDLFARVAAVGVAGWFGWLGWKLQRANSLQAEARKDREAAEAKQRDEQQIYLPVFDSLTVIELAIDDALQRLRADGQPGWRTDISRIGALPNFLTGRRSWLFEAASTPLTVSLPTLFSLSCTTNPQRHDDEPALGTYSLSDAMEFVARFLELAIRAPKELFGDNRYNEAVVFVGWKGRWLVALADADNPYPPHSKDRSDPTFMEQPNIYLPVDPAVRWADWAPPDRPTGEDFWTLGAGQFTLISFELLATLQREVARLQRDVLKRHPGLAEKYLTIRNTILDSGIHKVGG